MPRSRYDTNLEYTDNTCIVTLLFKRNYYNGHILLAFEANGIVNAENIYVCDFMSLPRIAEILQVLPRILTLTRDALSRPEIVDIVRNTFPQTIETVQALPFGRTFELINNPAILPLFEPIATELLSSSANSAHGLSDYLGFSKGIIRSSLPIEVPAGSTLSADQLLINACETSKFSGDESISWAIDIEDARLTIGRIQTEQRQFAQDPPYYSYMGTQSLLSGWRNSRTIPINCMDWALAKARTMHNCTQEIQNAESISRNWLGYRTPYTTYQSLKNGRLNPPVINYNQQNN